jgi:DNA adenine methylase
MSYNGGKAGAGVAQQIINQIPPHRVYIEPFVGAGAVLRAKLPATIAIAVDADDRIIARWKDQPGLIAKHGDALEFLCSYSWRGDEFVYCDPPYLMETRSGQRSIYRHEFATIEQHRALLTLLRTIPAPVAISGYASWLYELELAGWRSISFQTVKRSGQVATEWLWMNYPSPLELHDYRYLGNNFRERERIKRKRERWKARLRGMDDLERHALLAALEEVRRDPIASAGDAGRLVGIASAGDGS